MQDANNRKIEMEIEIMIEDEMLEMWRAAYPNWRMVSHGTFPFGEWTVSAVYASQPKPGLLAADGERYTFWIDGRVTRNGQFVTV